MIVFNLGFPRCKTLAKALDDPSLRRRSYDAFLFSSRPCSKFEVGSPWFEGWMPRGGAGGSSIDLGGGRTAFASTHDRDGLL